MSVRQDGREVVDPNSTGSDTERVLCLAVHPLDPLVAMGTESSLVKIYNLKTFSYEEVLPQIGTTLAVDFSPCGHYFAAAASSHKQNSFLINLYGIDSDGKTFRFTLETDDSYIPDAAVGSSKLHQDDITALKFRPQKLIAQPCGVLVSGSADQTVRIWYFENLDTSMTRYVSRRHKDVITAVSFSDGGRIMATAAANHEVIIWKFKPNQNLELQQMIALPMNGEVPHCLDFFPRHQLVPNPYGNPLREYTLAIGTDKSLQIFLVSQTQIEKGWAIVDWDKHIHHGAEEMRLDVFSDEDEEREKAQASPAAMAARFKGKSLERPRSFRSLRGWDEILYQDEKDDVVDLKLAVSTALFAKLVHYMPIEKGVRSVSATFHTVVPADPWRKHYGCNYCCYGTFTGEVLAVTFSAQRNPDVWDQFNPTHHCILTAHKTVATSISLPSGQLQQALQREKFLLKNQYFCISSSVDETVQIVKFKILPKPGWDAAKDARDIPHEFLPHPPQKDELPTVLERPITEHLSQQMNAIREIVRENETDEKRAEEHEVLRKQRIESFGYLSGQMKEDEAERRGVEVAAAPRPPTPDNKVKLEFKDDVSSLDTFQSKVLGSKDQDQEARQENFNKQFEVLAASLDTGIPDPPKGDAARLFTPAPAPFTSAHMKPKPGTMYKEATLEQGVSKLHDFAVLAKRQHDQIVAASSEKASKNNRMCIGPDPSGVEDPKADNDSCSVM